MERGKEIKERQKDEKERKEGKKEEIEGHQFGGNARMRARTHTHTPHCDRPKEISYFLVIPITLAPL